MSSGNNNSATSTQSKDVTMSSGNRNDTAAVQADIAAVQAEIKAAQAQIDAARSEIADLEKAITVAENEDLRSELAKQKETLRDKERDFLYEKDKLRDKEKDLLLSKIRDIENRNSGAPSRLICFSVSISSKDAQKRAEFRATLPDTPYPGAFVAHDFYIAFVKAARRMTERKKGKKVKKSQWRQPKALWKGAIEKVTELGNSITWQHNSLLSRTNRDLEELQSAIAAELLRYAIGCLQEDPTKKPILVLHQFTIADTVKEEPGISLLFPPDDAKSSPSKRKKASMDETTAAPAKYSTSFSMDETTAAAKNRNSSSMDETKDSPVKRKRSLPANETKAPPAKRKKTSKKELKIEFKVDILVWVSTKIATMGCTAIAATEYKPDARDEDARKAQADMYGVNIMSMHQRPCIAVDIQGGNDWTSWKVCASAIIPIALRETGSSYSKSTLFEGTGAEGIVGLAAGVIKAVDCIPEKANDFGRLLGPVVGYSSSTKKVTKAYDGATYRRPNYDLVQEFVDSSASILKSRDKKLQLVETTYFATNWTKPVRLSAFADLLEQLRLLHKDHGPHGDIRLANMLRKEVDEKETACLTDFDFVRNPTYPRGLNNITDDGDRHEEVVSAIKGKTIADLPIKKEHDWHSMHAVMNMFEFDDSSETSVWNRCKKSTKEGNLKEAVTLLREEGGAATVALSKPSADKIREMMEAAGTGATP